MQLIGKRLYLRPWKDDDARSLYELANDPAIGPSAGWPPHKTIKESRQIIATVFSDPKTYAICLKENDEIIGAISLMRSRNDSNYPAGQCELGFWIGKPYWGHAYVKEASLLVLKHAFEDLNMNKVWCGYYAGNEKSAKAQAKIGFAFDHLVPSAPVPLLNEYRDEIVNVMSSKTWQTIKARNKI